MLVSIPIKPDTFTDRNAQVIQRFVCGKKKMLTSRNTTTATAEGDGGVAERTEVGYNVFNLSIIHVPLDRS